MSTTIPTTDRRGAEGRRPEPLGAWPLLKLILAPVASLKLTVVLFVLSLLLVFFGTIAQMDAGVWTVVNQYFRSYYVWVPVNLLVKFGQVFFWLPTSWQASWSFPFPGGVVIGSLLLLNLVSAHLVRFKLSWRRSGVLVLHAGLLLMMVGEGIAAKFSVEGQMFILNGQSSNYLMHVMKAELAVIDSSGADADDVVVVPDSILRRGGVIQDERLPFDVEVEEYMTNSTRVGPAAAEGPNRATAGDGVATRVLRIPEVSGTDTDDTVDYPAAFVTLKRKDTGEALGTYLFASWMTQEQPVTVGEKSYGVSLRHKRSYKPYTIQLLEFRHDRYPGTNKPRNFSSRVRLLDPTHSEDREALIYMNSPLRYDGETFYQSRVLGEDMGTVLQVVRNPAWLMPYISCVVVGVGMLIHFSILLVSWLPKPQPYTFDLFADLAAPVAAGGMAVFYLALMATASADPPGGLGLAQFAELPVQEGGRVKPIDTFARVSLMSLNDKQTYTDEKGQSHSAVEWMLDVMVGRLGAENRPYFKIDDPELREFLALEGKPGQRFTYAQLRDKKDQLAERVLPAVRLDPKEVSPLDRKLIEVSRDMHLFEQVGRFATPHQVFRVENLEVQALAGLEPRSSYRYALTEFTDRLPKIQEEARKAAGVAEKSRTLYQTKVLALWHKLGVHTTVANFQELSVIPPAEGDEWRPLVEVNEQATKSDQEAVESFARILQAYVVANGPEHSGSARSQGAKNFNSAVADYRKVLDKKAPGKLDWTSYEMSFNTFAPFFHLMFVYLLALMLAMSSWLAWPRGLNRAAFWLMVVAVLVHTWALYARCVIQGRPPVTNLYSSAVFIGWGCVLLCLVLEHLFRYGIALAIGAVTGTLTLFLAHHLAGSGDTLEMLQAVLDTNFWLATHVVCVTLGYTATFVAGFLGMAYIVAGLFTPVLKGTFQKTLAQMVYGVVCFATLLSFIGTVLGGIWGDQSWGRFWGWDPKENGALLIVVWNALILHARWGGMVKQRGVAVLAVVGNMVTAWSWFGTNQLGIGLHSYGFSNALANGLVIFWACCAVFIALGLVPLQHWRSFARPQT